MQVTSWNPLVVYLYEEGLGRFATELYNVEHIERRCMHLTNYSLNKHNKKFVPNTDAAQVRPPAPGAHLPRLGQGWGVLCWLTRASRRHARMTPAPSGASQLSGVKWRKTSARRKPLRCVHAHAPFVRASPSPAFPRPSALLARRMLARGLERGGGMAGRGRGSRMRPTPADLARR